MSAVYSQMMPLGTQTMDFSLIDVVSKKLISLSSFADKKVLLIMFICRHCPFVLHVKKELANLARDYKDKDIGIIAISSSDINAYPQDAPQGLKQMAIESEFTFPLCFDETQDVAKAYTAACTPDFFLFSNEKLAYRGQLDDSRPGNGIPVTGMSLRSAIDALLQGKIPDEKQKPSMGCSIKWKLDNQPSYFSA